MAQYFVLGLMGGSKHNELLVSFASLVGIASTTFPKGMRS
jgi:hypothetical protein